MLSDFAGIPFQVSEYVPKGEVWLIQEGKKATIRAHEGPQAGEEFTVWLQRQSAVKMFDLGEISEPKIEFSIKRLGTWAAPPAPPTPPDVKRLQMILERERSKVAEGLSAMKKVLDGRHWLTEGRGPYEWDDDRWHGEFLAAGQEMIAAMKPLESIARDLTDCPTDQKEIQQARAGAAPAGEAEEEHGKD